METYASVLNIAIPAFMVLILIEHLVGRWKGIQVNRVFDTISSLSSGLTNTIRDVLKLTVVIVSYSWMVEHFAIFKIESSLALYVLAFIGLDFAGYWNHRFSHVINVFWNRHLVHHSSEEFNLSCALRQSVSNIIGIFFFLYLPLALLGVPTKVIAVVAPIQLFAQFWYHTRLIDKMGFLEYIIVTPSHHRVHHAINDEYLDKNFSQIFIIWDKLFGTFQEELKDKPPVYGIKKPVKTWNPLVINYLHMWLLFKDAWRTEKLWDKVRIWFMPTGWRPEDVKKAYPLASTKDPYAQKKYETAASPLLKMWMLAQLFLTGALMLFLFNRIADYALFEILMGGLFLLLSIFSYTSLMDGSKINLITEVLKLLVGIGLLVHLNGWFGIDQFIAFGSTTVMLYIVISMLAAVYFTYFDKARVVEYQGV